jgi:hypothetical protein
VSIEWYIGVPEASELALTSHFCFDYQELKNYMLKHGGRLVNYFSRHTVSHIICSNLPDSKKKNLR